jgi:alpha-glucoside transport system substrate-binding protein
VYEQFGDLAGTTVTTYGGEVFDELDQGYERAWAGFERCTGVDVQREWSLTFEDDVSLLLGSDEAPDVAMFVQPAFLAEVVRDTGAAVPVFAETRPVVEASFSPDLIRHGVVDGTLYGFPFGRFSLKSLVWYSPAAFAEAGYEVPTTWEELIALSDRIVADHPDGDVKPWCAGIEVGPWTGWPLTDWVEDVMLREQGADYYDAWVSHEVPFDAPQSLTVWETVGSVLRNPDYVNGGFGDVASIASTFFGIAGLPILDGECAMMRMASFYRLNFPKGASVADDGDLFVFYLPTKAGTRDRPMLVGGDYVAAFADRPEVRAFMTFLASPDSHNGAESQIGFAPTNLGVDIADVDSALGRFVVRQLRDPSAVLRFDGSDLMPGEVGAGSFLSEGTAWIAEGKDTAAVLDAIESSWPR